MKLGLYDTQWMNCVNDRQVLAWDTSKEDAVHRAVMLAEKYCIENAKEVVTEAEKVQSDMLLTMIGMCNYIDKLGGDSKAYRQQIHCMKGEQ